MPTADEILQELQRVLTPPVTVTDKADPVEYSPSPTQAVLDTPKWSAVSDTAPEVALHRSETEADQPGSTAKLYSEFLGRFGQGAKPFLDGLLSARGVVDSDNIPQPFKRLAESPMPEAPSAREPEKPPEKPLISAAPPVIKPKSDWQAWGKLYQDTVRSAPIIAAIPPPVKSVVPAAIAPPQKTPNGLAVPRATSSTVGSTLTLPTKPVSAKKEYPYSPLLEPPRPTGNRVVVSLPDKRVVVYGPDGNILRHYSVYVGTAKNPTPKGEFRIMQGLKPEEPYFGPGFMGFAESLPMDKNGFWGFHGWVYDASDDAEERRTPGWKTSTHGCIQMQNSDVAEFARFVGPGDKVTIIDRPILQPTMATLPRPQVIR